jgi:ribosomal-protein-alanine N-acetyltransferase
MISRLESNRSSLRSMKESDFQQVVEIERATFPTPWILSSFRDCVAFGYRCRVFEQEGLVQVYAVMAIEGHTAHILNLCVRPELRHRGEGRRMLNHLIELARVAQVEAIFLEVRASNHPALHLYQSSGFVKIGIRKGYYPIGKEREDALILVRRSSENQ